MMLLEVDADVWLKVFGRFHIVLLHLPIAWLGGNGLSLDVAHMDLRQAVAVLPWTSHLGEKAKAGLKLMTSSYTRNASSASLPSR